MTVGSILRALWRRWYVVLIGVAVLACALAWVSSRKGVYSAQVDVVVLAPKSARNPNVIEQTSQSLIAMAGLVERDVNKGIKTPATASSNVSLAGEGIRNGYSITLPNSGGQWANDFERPVLDVQVIGPDQDAVRRQLKHLVGVIEKDLYTRQSLSGAAPGSFITASSAPSKAVIFYLDGNKKKALGAILVLGGGLIPLSAVGADRLINARARRIRNRTPMPQVAVSA